MLRRNFLKVSSVGAAAAMAAGPARAQSLPTLRWRLASSFPKNLDTVFGAAEVVANRVSEMTEGKFQIRAFAGGEIVPALQVLDAVQQGTIECGHTAGFYYTGKESTLVFDTGIPFGLTPRQHSAWVYYGGGLDLMREVYKKFNAIQIPCGNTGAQMGGWYRKEIKSPADLEGLRMRVPGFAGQVMARLGVVPQTIPGSDVYQALERGTLDALDWVGPYDDEKFGLHKVAKYYYGPGVMEPGAATSLIVNIEQWNALPRPYQAVLVAACKEAEVDMLAKYDAKNAAAIGRLVKQGVKLAYYPQSVVEAMRKATNEVLDEEAAKNPAFQKVYASWKPFRNEQHRWFSINDAAAERWIYATASK